MSKRLPHPPAASPRVTIRTVADAAGVSVCTVNKALTGKPRVSEETRRRIVEIARRLGYRRNRIARSLSCPPVEIGVVSPDAWPAHYRLLLDGVRSRVEELSDFRLSARFAEVSDMTDGAEFHRAVRELIDAGVSGLILAPGDYPPARRKMLDETLRDAGIPFVWLGGNGDDSSFPYRIASVGQAGAMCGRWAAELLTLMTPPGSLCAILAGSAELRDHALKIAAFRAEFAARGGAEPVVVETRDRPEIAETETLRLLERHPALRGLYIATENLPGVETALDRAGRSGAIRTVATGISPRVLDGIAAGRIHASIFQQENSQGRMAVDLLFPYLGNGTVPPPENSVPPRVVMRSNLELFRTA